MRSLHATLGDGQEVVQGQEVDLTDEDEARFDEQGGLVPVGFASFDEFHAVAQDAYRGSRGDQEAAQRLVARSGVPGAGPTSFADDGGQVSEYVEYLREESPSIDDVIAEVGDDPEAAKAMLVAEETVSGGNPRQGVVKGLTKIIGE
jgi:hypothetical protein